MAGTRLQDGLNRTTDGVDPANYPFISNTEIVEFLWPKNFEF